jgi:hypothetical protein
MGKYYDIHNLMKLSEEDKDIKYLISFGERSAGKSYSTACYIIENYVNKHKTSGIARRWDDDWGQNVAQTYFNSLVSNGEIKRITNGEWDNVWYWSHKWYLCKYDNEKEKLIKDEQPFAIAFSLSTWEKTKASQYPDMNLLVLEEFISNRYIGADNTEFQMFLNLISTLARDREDFRVILLGNSIAKYGNPYFICMDIEKRVLKMKPGETVVFSNDYNRLKIACEFTDPPKEGKKSDILFDFIDSAAARQITSGEWQIEAHFASLPLGTRIKPMDVIYKYFIVYRENILQADIILQGQNYYTFIHRKTTELQENYNDLIFDLEYHLEPNYRRDITRPTDNITKKVAEFFKKDMVFVQDVEIGEILYSYIQSL